MTNNGAVSKTLTPSSASTVSYTIPAGYHNGSGKVTVSKFVDAVANIIPPGSYLAITYTGPSTINSIGTDKKFTFRSNTTMIIANVTGLGYTKVAFSDDWSGSAGAFVRLITKTGTTSAGESAVTSKTLSTSTAYVIISGSLSNATDYTVTFS